MSLELTDDKSALVQVMAWCYQATSHYLSQCWPRSLSPYRITRPQWVNIMRSRQNVCRFAEGIFKCISWNGNIWILNKISVKFAPSGLIDNTAALVQIMAWRRIGHKPLSEAILVCCTDTYMHKPQWFKLCVYDFHGLVISKGQLDS